MRRFAFAVLAAACLTAAPAQAGEPYPFDLPRTAPRAMAAWKSVVPAAWRKVGWIADFAGVGLGPVETLRVEGRDWLIGSVCKPHDCGDNVVAFLLAPDGSGAYGLLRARAPRAADVAIGAPPPALRALLARRLAP